MQPKTSLKPKDFSFRKSTGIDPISNYKLGVISFN